MLEGRCSSFLREWEDPDIVNPILNEEEETEEELYQWEMREEERFRLAARLFDITLPVEEMLTTQLNVTFSRRDVVVYAGDSTAFPARNPEDNISTNPFVTMAAGLTPELI